MPLEETRNRSSRQVGGDSSCRCRCRCDWCWCRRWKVGGWATLRLAPALDNLVLNPYFGRRQFSGKRAVIRDSLARWSSRREGGSSESELEFKRPKMLQ